MMFRHIACGISGGVDSAVAALLLKKRGFEVTGVFMRNWDVADEAGECRADQELEDARYICRRLRLPLVEVNFVKEYWTDVFSIMVDEYKAGTTPNPDIMCNRRIKFDAFFKYAREELGADAIATGHYAKTSFGESLEHYDEKKGARLLRAVDQLKDQTFFLSQVRQKALQRTMFPIGDFTKEVVKHVAASEGLFRIVSKKESMGICFIGSRNFQKFLEQYVEPEPGFFVNIEGRKVVGTHKGSHLWTVGQRCMIGGQRNAFYVVDKTPSTNEILVAEGTNHPSLYTTTFFTEPSYWLHSMPEDLRIHHVMECQFRFQHKHPLISCRVTLEPEERLTVWLERPMRAVTPGQFAVFYRGEECLGGSKICGLGPSLFDMNYKTFTELDKRFT